jgi:hypothetical protein
MSKAMTSKVARIASTVAVRVGQFDADDQL